MNFGPIDEAFDLNNDGELDMVEEYLLVNELDDSDDESDEFEFDTNYDDE